MSEETINEPVINTPFTPAPAAFTLRGQAIDLTALKASHGSVYLIGDDEEAQVIARMPTRPEFRHFMGAEPNRRHEAAEQMAVDCTLVPLHMVGLADTFPGLPFGVAENLARLARAQVDVTVKKL